MLARNISRSLVVAPTYLILTRAQIIVTFDTATRHRFLRTALSPRDPPLQQIPLLAIPPHPLIALVLRSRRGNDAWRGIPPLPAHPTLRQLKFITPAYTLELLTPAISSFHRLRGTCLPSLGSSAFCQDRP
jgi:hypothetical protein